MKVLHLPEPVAGNAWSVAQGERGLGLDSKVMYTYSNWLKYPYDVCYHLEGRHKLVQISKLVSIFFLIRNKFDIFHFNFGSSLINYRKLKLPLIDLPFYPEKAKLFVTYNGCDARQKYPTVSRTKFSACHNPECYEGICNSGARDTFRRRAINKMAKYVEHMWAVNPDLLYFLPKQKSSFLPYAVKTDDIKISRPNFDKKKLTIVHAPTNRIAKGSEYIITEVKKVQKLFPDQIELVIVESIPHKQALSVYQRADLVIDQILIGWYGGFAVEAMAMGKPVLCRIEKNDLHFIPAKMVEDLGHAIIYVNPTDLREVICRCIEDRNFLKLKSEAAIEYSRKWHNPRYVADITKAAYEA